MGAPHIRNENLCEPVGASWPSSRCFSRLIAALCRQGPVRAPALWLEEWAWVLKLLSCCVVPWATLSLHILLYPFPLLSPKTPQNTWGWGGPLFSG